MAILLLGALPDEEPRTERCECGGIGLVNDPETGAITPCPLCLVGEQRAREGGDDLDEIRARYERSPEQAAWFTSPYQAGLVEP